MNAWERLCAADRLVDACAVAIRLHHPQSVKLARVTVDRALSLDDARLVGATAALERWIADERPALPEPAMEAI